MDFASPFFLALLIPWAVLAAWLLLWRREGTHVPFLALWRVGAAPPPPRAQRRWNFPPAYLLAAIGAVLLAIFASARPTLALAQIKGPPITIIFDRGVTMSAGARRDEVIDQAREAANSFGAGPVDFIAVPYGTVQQTDRSGWVSLARSVGPSEADTRDAVRLAVRQALARNEAPVLLLSDHPAPADPRVIPISPTRRIANVGIVHAAAATRPRSQVMVTIRNDSPLTSATLNVRSGAESRQTEVALPPRGGERNVFVDLPALGSTVEVTLNLADDIAVDNFASLKQQPTWPHVELRGDVPPPVRRVVDAYTHARPASIGASVVAIPATAGEAGVIFASGDFAEAISAPIVTAAHPITANVDVKAMANPRVSAAKPPGDGWTAILSVAGNPIVAAREAPARQVWIGFESDEFARTPAFVIFWTNVLEWLGKGGPDAYRATIHPVTIEPPMQSDWRPKLAAIKPRAGRGLELTPWLASSALACIFLAVTTWPNARRVAGLTAFSAPRTV